MRTLAVRVLAPSGRRLASLAALLVACSGCDRPANAPSAPQAVVAAIDYEVHALDARTLDVVATVHGGADSIVAGAPAGVSSLRVDGVPGHYPLEALSAERWRVGCSKTCRIAYRYDLGRAAEASGDSLDVAVRSDGDVLAPASTWLLRPEPLTPDVPVTLTVRAEPPLRFSSSLRAASEKLSLVSQELSTLGYTAFGEPTELRVPVSHGTIDVSVLRGPRAASDASLERWVRETAASLDGIFGRFPVARARVFLVPSGDGSEVEIGRTLPSGGASIAVLIGGAARESQLFADWILAHELFHLGVPSFWNEGRWLDEGLATYYEPLARARAGLITEREAWDDLAGGLPRALPRAGDLPLAATDDQARIYWGGALFALRADLEIRRRTRGARSLDDGLRTVLALGGDATRIWSVDHFVKVVDAATATTVMTELYAQARAPDARTPCSVLLPGCAREEPVALDSLLTALGIKRLGPSSVELDDAAPLAALRRDLSRGAKGQRGKGAKDRGEGQSLAGPAHDRAQSAAPSDPPLCPFAPLPLCP